MSVVDCLQGQSFKHYEKLLVSFEYLKLSSLLYCCRQLDLFDEKKSAFIFSSRFTQDRTKFYFDKCVKTLLRTDKVLESFSIMISSVAFTLQITKPSLTICVMLFSFIRVMLLLLLLLFMKKVAMFINSIDIIKNIPP